MFGGPVQVRRNMINLHIIGDPLSVEGCELVSAALQLYMQGTCVRIGALFTSDLEGGADKQSVPFADLSLHGQFVRCFFHTLQLACLLNFKPRSQAF
jgi:hypothetical protein